MKTVAGAIVILAGALLVAAGILAHAICYAAGRFADFSAGLGLISGGVSLLVGLGLLVSGILAVAQRTSRLAATQI